MARIDLQFLPERFASSRIQKACAVSTRRIAPSQLLNVSGLALIVALAIASPSFGQRGSPAGGGAGGGSHAAAAPSGGGGSHSGGGGSGGGAARSSGGGNASHGGAVRGGSHWGGKVGGSGGGTASRGNSGSQAGGARGGTHWAGSAGGSQSKGGSSASQPGVARGVSRWVEPPAPVSTSAARDSGIRVGANGSGSRVYNGAGNGGAGFGSPASTAVQPNSRPQPTGFRAAIRRFFGIRSASPAIPARLTEGNPGNAVNTLVGRSNDSSRLPPVFNHIRLRGAPRPPSSPVRRLSRGFLSWRCRNRVCDTARSRPFLVASSRFMAAVIIGNMAAIRPVSGLVSRSTLASIISVPARAAPTTSLSRQPCSSI